MQTPTRAPSHSGSLGVVLGFGMGVGACTVWIAALIGTGCASSLADCQRQALRVLPKDPAMATAQDAADVAQRLLACDAAEQGLSGRDAGP
jgi:hypothetical protein